MPLFDMNRNYNKYILEGSIRAFKYSGRETFQGELSHLTKRTYETSVSNLYHSHSLLLPRRQLRACSQYFNSGDFTELTTKQWR